MPLANAQSVTQVTVIAQVCTEARTHNTAVASFECGERVQGPALDTQYGRQRPSTYEWAERRVKKAGK